MGGEALLPLIGHASELELLSCVCVLCVPNARFQDTVCVCVSDAPSSAYKESLGLLRHAFQMSKHAILDPLLVVRLVGAVPVVHQAAEVAELLDEPVHHIRKISNVSALGCLLDKPTVEITFENMLPGR